MCRLLSQAATPIEQRFVNDLKRSIEMTDKQEARKPSANYRPSAMKCERSMFYQRMGVGPESESNACLVGICESGTDRHARIQEAVSKMIVNGINCEYLDVAEYIKSRELPLQIVAKQGYETKLYDEKRHISFLCDGIIRYDNKYYILEIKTESIYKWVSRKDVAEEHRMQATAYSLLFNIPDVIFLYINRDNCDMKAFMFTPTSEELDGLDKKIEHCERCVQNKVLPDKILDDSACRYCGYRRLCDSNTLGMF